MASPETPAPEQLHDGFIRSADEMSDMGSGVVDIIVHESEPVTDTTETVAVDDREPGSELTEPNDMVPVAKHYDKLSNPANIKRQELEKALEEVNRELGSGDMPLIKELESKIDERRNGTKQKSDDEFAEIYKRWRELSEEDYENFAVLSKKRASLEEQLRDLQ